MTIQLDSISEPRALCYNPHDNKVYCANERSNNVTVIDGATNGVIATAAAGDGPCALSYNPLDNKVYCANFGSDPVYDSTVTVIDGAADTVIATVAADYEPCALCYNPTDNKIYCANWNNVTVIDGAADTVIATVVVDGYPCAFCYNPTNNKVYCADGDTFVTIIDGATDSIIRTIGVGDGPCDFTWNPAQNRVYVANHRGSSISVLRDSGGGIAETMNDERGTMNASPTIVRGVLVLGAVDSRQNTGRWAELLDIAGRKVLDLVPGVNDVRHLSPGIYFVRQSSGVEREGSSVHKVVVTE
jgi:YVTN family beta-propeller protein